MQEAQKESQRYSVRNKFVKGDVLEHVKFGPGIVDEILDGDKISVLFKNDYVTLVHNK